MECVEIDAVRNLAIIDKRRKGAALVQVQG